MKVLCLGDSLTAGIGGTAGNSYPDILEKILKKNYGETVIINNGRPGDSTKDFYNYLNTSIGTICNLEELLPWFKPDIKYDLVIIMLGTNDCRTDNWVEWEDSLKYLEKTIDLASRWVPDKENIIICTLIPLADPMPPKIVGGAHTWEQDKIKKKLNPGIRGLAKKKKISIFDIYTPFCEMLAGGEELYDGIHPYNNGYRFMGEKIGEYILSNFGDIK